jgi:hypothetical protein
MNKKATEVLGMPIEMLIIIVALLVFGLIAIGVYLTNATPSLLPLQ